MSLQNGVAIGRSFSPKCGVKVDPEGNVWAINGTGGHLNPINGAPSPHSAIELYKSTDNCKTFKLQGSNDGENYFDIQSITNNTAGENEYTNSDENFYSYYRF